MKYEITKEQILSLYMGGGNEGKLKEWFPEAFETVLEVGKWYFQTDSKALVNYQGGSSGYGFCASDMEYDEEYHHWSFKTHRHEWREATESEIFEALKNEAVKRGYKQGQELSSFIGGTQEIPPFNKFEYDTEEHILKAHGAWLFKNGVWATILKDSITKEEAEKLLNKKIV